jgi:CheY-like chemotaxis protein
VTPSPRRVLVVDDDPGIRGFLTGALEDEGYDVREAGDGRIALRILQGQEGDATPPTQAPWIPDAIILDLYMPDMDGWAFRAAQLALPAPLANIPVLVISASRSLGPRTVDLRAAAVMEKPFELDDLMERLSRAIGPR